jgi:hypothetical protein
VHYAARRRGGNVQLTRYDRPTQRLCTAAMSGPLAFAGFLRMDVSMAIVASVTDELPCHRFAGPLVDAATVLSTALASLRDPSTASLPLGCVCVRL